MTPLEIIIAAQGICSDYTDEYPTARSVMYRRISARQREIFVHIGTLDAEFYGEDIVTEVTDGAVNLAALEQSGDVYPIETIHVVRIQDPGESSYAVGAIVSIVPVDDYGEFLSPRCTLRSGVLRQVGTDLDSVVSLRVSYSRRPREIGLDGSGEIELLEPFQDLLVFDLAKDLVRRTVGLEGERKAAVMGLVEAQEEELLESLAAHIENAARFREQRFHA